MSATKKIFLITSMLLVGELFAQEIITDRPDQTESSVTVEKKTFQIEMGGTYLTTEKNSINSFLAPSMLLRYGISKGVELRFVTQYESTKFEFQNNDIDYNGFNDIEVGAKFQLLKKENKNTEIAFLTHVIIPTANTRLSTNNWGVVNKLSISHFISEKISLGYNIGYDYIQKLNFLTYSLALGFGISDVVSFYVEPFGTWGESNIFMSNLDTGFTFLLNPNFQLDTSYGLGLNNSMQYYSVGFSWRIQDFLVKK